MVGHVGAHRGILAALGIVLVAGCGGGDDTDSAPPREVCVPAVPGA